MSQSWRRFLEIYEPLRPALYRFCRYLSRSPWDAEDLVQDALARAFATLGGLIEPPRDPRAWLFRVASNLWIDHVRRRDAQPSGDVAAGPAQGGAEAAASAALGRETREAAGTLLVQLSPQERAAVVLKDAFDLGLEEIAEILSTSVGAVKAALHRGRGKLAEPDPDVSRTPAPGALDAFCAAFNARDLDRLTALLLDHATVEVVGASTIYGAEHARGTVLTGMLFGSKYMATPPAGSRCVGMDPRFVQGALPEPVRLELRFHRGEHLLLSWYAHHDGDFVRAVSRLELSGDGERIVRLRNYFYTPEIIVELCGELGVPCRSNGTFRARGAA
ncbi:MAG TPA: RNA polymerase sigma factor [Kofleriaceae bacterium]|nr:RNA polymerase sigma factor [Kofleriaceae bacterium]